MKVPSVSNLVVVLALTASPGASAQETQPSYASLLPSTRSLAELSAADAVATTSANTAGLTSGGWITPAKWVGLGTSVGFGILGFTIHARAQDDFEKLQRKCLADPANCREINPDGSYTDPQLEALYQSILDKDNAARASLIVAQLGFAVTAALFIIDFQRGGGPADIPYDPEEPTNQFRLTVIPGEVILRYYFQ